MLADVVRAALARAGTPAAPKLPAEVAVEFVVGAFRAIVRWWLDEPSPQSAEDIDRASRSLVAPGLRQWS